MTGEWSHRHDADRLVALPDESDVPNSQAYIAPDREADRQYRAFGVAREAPDRHFGTVLQAGLVPHGPESPDIVRRSGPYVGEHHHEVLSESFGFDDAAIEGLEREGVL